MQPKAQEQKETQKETRKPTREQILALAERLASREGVASSWITYPEWAGAAPDIRPILEKATKFKTWARAILAGELPPPAWLAEEDPAFREAEQAEQNNAPKTPDSLPASECQTPKQEMRTPPPATSLSEAEAYSGKSRYFQRRTYPLIAAWILRTTSPSPRSRPVHRRKQPGDNRAVCTGMHASSSRRREKENRGASRGMRLFGN